jgi:hypothetical protein
VSTNGLINIWNGISGKKMGEAQESEEPLFTVDVNHKNRIFAVAG